MFFIINEAKGIQTIVAEHAHDLTTKQKTS